jgi:5'-nucleotidase/UDP-sugar diphosphatase
MARRIRFASLILALTTGVHACKLMTAASNSTATPRQSIRILHTGDIHAQLIPLKRDGTRCSQEEDDARLCVGGAARLYSAVQEARSALGDRVLLFDTGDVVLPV